ncbi:hypothetical protein [Enterovibrio norvegicus]|uniref:hypothetical protein n=1 Tax=Enterovibrio norvegicus TaxID=188144 RepID=UPI00352DA589
MHCKKGSMDLREVAGTTNFAYEGETWGSLLPINSSLREIMSERMNRTLSMLDHHPHYYLQPVGKDDWSFSVIAGKTYINSGVSRTIIARHFLEASGVAPIIHGVKIYHFEKRRLASYRSITPLLFSLSLLVLFVM